MARKKKTKAIEFSNHIPDGGAASGAPSQNNVSNTSNRSFDYSVLNKAISRIAEKNTHDPLNEAYNSLCKLRSILERVIKEDRQCSPIEFFESSILIQLATNNIFILKNQATRLGTAIKDSLFINKSNSLELISHLDRDTLAHVLNLEYFHKSHTEISLGQEFIHKYWYEQIFAENSIFDRITIILQENISSHTSGESSGSSADSSDPVFDCYYNTKTSGLPKIIGAIISNSHNKFDYQRSFNGKGESILKLLKFNLDIAIKAREDESYESLIMYIQAIQAVGNCAKILKLISHHDIPESINSALPILIQVRNKFAHASNLKSISKIKANDSQLNVILEELSANLSSLIPDDIEDESIEIELEEEVLYPDEETSEHIFEIIKPKKNKKLRDDTDEYSLIADGVMLANYESNIIEQIKSEILQNSKIGNELYKISRRAVDLDLFEYISTLVRNSNFDINQTIRVFHKPLALNAKSKHGKTPLELHRIELEALLQENFKIEGQEVETEILPLNLIIYLSQKTNDSRYEELISKLLLENTIDYIHIKKLNLHTNPLLMFMFGENIVTEKILKYVRQYYETFCKSIVTEFKLALKNPQTKIYKLLEKLAPNIDIPLAGIAVISEDHDLFELNNSIVTTLTSEAKFLYQTNIYYRALIFGKKEIIKFLHAQNFNVNGIIGRGELEALHYVCKSGNLEMVKILIDIGADINKTSKEGYTPLEYALYFRKMNVATYFLSLEKTDFRIVNYLMYACIQAQDERLEFFMRGLLAKDGVDVNKECENGFTPLILAAQSNNIIVGKMLLSHADINIYKTLPDGQSALTIAAGEGNVEFIKLLLSHTDIDVNHKAKNGYTALMIAAEEGHFDAVKTLLENDRVDAKVISNKGDNALGRALFKEYINIFELLINSDKVDINQADIFLRVLQMDEGPYQEKLIDLILSRNDFNMDNIPVLVEVPIEAPSGGKTKVIINIPAFICAANYCPQDNGNKYAMKKLFEKQSGKKIVKQIFDYCRGVSFEFNILLDRLIQVKLELDMLEDVTELDDLNLSGEAFNPIEE